MADADLETRLRDLKKRVEREPRSRFFVPLAEEYRKAGRLPDAIRALEEGLTAHPGYVAARVALARALLETGRIEESLEAFSKVLIDDPSNLVAAKALGDIHLSRGEPVKALKRYLRFRAVSGDRRLDEVIAKLRDEAAAGSEAFTAPEPAASLRPSVLPPPPFAPPAPPEGSVEPTHVVSPLPPLNLWPAPPPRRETDPLDITSVPWAPSAKSEAGSHAPEPAEQMLSRDMSLEAIPAAEPTAGEGPGRRIRLPEANWPFERDGDEDEKSAPSAIPASDAASGSGASGRTLAELYFEQGHDVEAIRVADELLVAIPGDEGLRRLRDEAAHRLAGSRSGATREEVPPAVADPGRERRLAKIHLLNQWLDAVSEKSRE